MSWFDQWFGLEILIVPSNWIQDLNTYITQLEKSKSTNGKENEALLKGKYHS